MKDTAWWNCNLLLNPKVANTLKELDKLVYDDELFILAADFNDLYPYLNKERVRKIVFMAMQYQDGK